MALTNDDIKKLARLSRIALTDAQQADALQSLNAILGLIDDLQNAQVDDIDPMAYVQLHGTTLRTRPAAAREGYSPQALMQNAPETAEEYFLVPPVIE